MSLVLSPPLSLIKTPRAPRAAGPIPVTITGTITDSSGRPACSGWIEFSIQPESQSLNYSVLPDINVVTPTRGRIVAGGQMVSDCSSMAPFVVWPNDLILPSNTLYQITIAPWGQVTKVLNGVIISSSVNPQSIANLTFVDPQNQVVGPIVNANPLVTMSVVPGLDSTWSIGTPTESYVNGYFQNLYTDTLYCSNFVPPISGAIAFQSSNMLGQPQPSQIVMLYTAWTPTVFPSNFQNPTSYGSALGMPTNSAVFTVMQNQTQVGTVTISPGGTSWTWSTAGFTLNPGDTFWVTAPSVYDPTLSDVALTFVGTPTS